MRDKKEIINLLKENNADAIIILDDSTRYWLTGFRSSAGVSVLSLKETALFLDGRYVEKAYSEKCEATIYPCQKGILSEACEYIFQNSFKTVLVDENRISLGEYNSLLNLLKNIVLKTQKNIFSELISIKNQEEIRYIKEAVKITDECFLHILNVINKNTTESDISAEINYFINKCGCELAFETIAVSGVKSSMPHGTPEKVLLTENSFLTMDFGAKYKGYCADLTRTVVLGKADEQMKNVYQTVYDANLKGISSAKPGVKCKDVDFSAREHITFMGYGEFFSHSTGHSLGVEIHEYPSVSRLSETVLKEGNVITIEPGIYIPNKYGVRIEDTVLITSDGVEVLSTSSKNLIEI
jgi:Xaa-Pro aminopeptidase